MSSKTKSKKRTSPIGLEFLRFVMLIFVGTIMVNYGFRLFFRETSSFIFILIKTIIVVVIVNILVHTTEWGKDLNHWLIKKEKRFLIKWLNRRSSNKVQKQ